MCRRLSSVVSIVALTVGTLVFMQRGVALAAPPANDQFANAAPISTFPFFDSGDLNGTTTESGEPQACNYQQQTVWYVLTPSSRTVVRADLNGSDFGVVFNVYQQFGSDIGGLGFINCIGYQGSAEFTAEANTTYYIQVGSVSTGPAHMQLNVARVPPPGNDDFANATMIDTRPFQDITDLTAATVEPGEPTLPIGAFTPIVASAWYSFTPQVTETLIATGDSCCVTPIVAVYTGSSLQSLASITAHSGPGGAVFEAAAGTTYYIQLGRGVLYGGTAPMTLRLGEAPPPTASFFYYPFDPSSYDTVQFQDNSFDPAQVGFGPQVWQFGDGTAASGQFVAHHYAADGDYTAVLMVTTLDGRTASSSQLVRVRTHDVAITKFTVSSTAKAGQTRALTIGVRNSLYPESVQFQFFRSVPGGYQPIGTLTQLIPVRPGNKTVPVSLSYTFSSDDAAVGKVTFQVIAQVLSGRDAIPADNTAISAPVRVNP
jgi:PKD repeat protein